MKQKAGKDLTEGNILRHLIIFSLPLLIGNVFQNLHSAINSFWVGHYVGKEALGAVSLVFPIMFFLVSLAIGAVMGSTILVAQFYGAKDWKQLENTISTSFLFTMLSSLIISAVGIWASGYLLRLMNTPAEIFPLAHQFLIISFGGLLFSFGYNLLNAILRGMGDTVNPLKFLIFSTVLNVILDPPLIIGLGPFPKLGVQGAAWATVISQAAAFFFTLFYLNKNSELLSIKISSLKIDWSILQRMMKLGIPIGVQSVAVSLGMLFLTALINRFGAEVVAGYGAASRISAFATLPAMSLSSGVSTLAGQNIGARKLERIKEIIFWGAIVAALGALTMTVLIQLGASHLVRIFTPDPEVVAVGESFLRIESLGYLFFMLMFAFNGVLQGAGRTFLTMLVSIGSLWVIRLPLAYFLAISLGLGAKGIWISVPISYLAGFLLSYSFYRLYKFTNI